ncbi:MAG: DNA primase [Chloroflexota bacterium]|nr:DNA primase [Chloroflexota bacterium]
MSKIDEVKSRLDIVDIVSDYVELRKSGRNYSGLCPFHSDTEPSFVVFPETQGWHCFGCGEGGDVFTFIMKREGLTFGEALRLLARRAGVELKPLTEEQKKAAAQRERLQRIMSAAAEYYHQLLHSSTGEEARAYIQRRGLTEETVERFQLGYAPDQWEALKGHLLGQGYTLDNLVAAGIVVKRKEGTGGYDRFRHRLMIPIRLPQVGEKRGQVIAFGGRVLREEDVPKYLNSPQTPLFDKSATLFGLDRAQEAIRRRDQAVIVEGYMDVLQAHQHGFTNVVASMGTSLTEDQLRSLTRLTTNLVLALDADTAGTRAILRGLEVARGALDRRVTPVITPQGLVRYEGRLEIALHITILPQGKDPDDVIRADTDHWRRLIEEALPVLDYYFQALTADIDFSDPKGKVEAVRRLGPILSEIKNQVERTHYLQRLARMVRVDERALARQISETRPRHRRVRKPPSPEEEPTEATVSGRFGMQEHCLACLAGDPSLLEWLNEQLVKIEVPPLALADFIPSGRGGRVENEQIFQALLQVNRSSESRPDADMLRETLDPLLHDYLGWLLEMNSFYDDLPPDKLREDLLVTALRLREESLRARLTQLHFLHLDAQAEGQQDVIIKTGKTIDRLEEELRDVQRAFSRRFSLGRQRLEHALGL